MAIACCSYHGFVIPTIIKPSRNRNRVFMLHSSSNQPSKLFIASSSIQNKVFEDHSMGIICYKNENGEIICEGYDEGPRFHHHRRQQQHHISTTAYQVIDIQQQWFQFVQDNGLISSSSVSAAAAAANEGVVQVPEELDSIIISLEDTTAN